MGLKLLSSRVPLVAIGDFDLAGALTLVEIYTRASARACSRPFLLASSAGP